MGVSSPGGAMMAGITKVDHPGSGPAYLHTQVSLISHMTLIQLPESAVGQKPVMDGYKYRFGKNRSSKRDLLKAREYTSVA